VALLVAEALELPFTCTNRIDTHPDSLYPIEYRLPQVLRGEVTGKRTVVVMEVISAASAVGGTLADQLDCGARPEAIGALAVVGDSPARLAARHAVPLELLALLTGPGPRTLARFARRTSRSPGNPRPRDRSPVCKVRPLNRTLQPTALLSTVRLPRSA
jgi:hypothetical protein